MIKILSILSVILFANTSIAAQTIDDLNVYTELSEPFSYQDKHKLTGIAVDVFEEVMKRLNSGTSIDRVKMLDWHTGYDHLKNDQNACLFLVVKSPNREPLFKWAGPVIQTRVSLFGLTKNPTPFKVEDMKNYKYSAVRDDIGYQLLKSMNIPSTSILLQIGHEAGIRDLVTHSANYWANEYFSAMSIINKSLNHKGDYTEVATLSKGDMYIAFNKHVDDALVAKIQAAINDIKTKKNSDGKTTFDLIMQKYHL